jgi:hypothetical protein
MRSGQSLSLVIVPCVQDQEYRSIASHEEFSLPLDLPELAGSFLQLHPFLAEYCP